MVEEEETILTRFKTIIKRAKHIKNCTISDTKHNLTNVGDELIFLHMRDILGNIKISHIVSVINNNHHADYDFWKGTDIAGDLLKITSIPCMAIIKIFLPILIQQNIIYIDHSIVDKPIFCLDESKNYLKFVDIFCELMPSLVLDDGSTAGYAALSSIDDVCLVIDMNIDGPLQQLLNMPFGKYIIQRVSSQNGKCGISDIGQITLFLYEKYNAEELYKFKINRWEYYKLVSFIYKPTYKNYKFDLINNKYQKLNQPEGDNKYDYGTCSGPQWIYSC